MTNLIDAIASRVARLLGGQTGPEPLSGFKTVGDKWFAWWSNNLEDREGEFFSEKAIDEYVMRVDVGVVPMPELWFWHIPGTRHGVADWVGRIGHFAVAAGSFDDTPLGKAAKAHYSKGGGNYGMSHGFTYDPGQKRGNVYEQFNTFELSVLPASAAANVYTSFAEVKSMNLSDQKRAALTRLLGDELAGEVIAKTEEKSKAIDALEIRYKDFVRMIDGDDLAAVKEDGAEIEDESATVVEDTGEAKAEMAGLYATVVEDVAALATIVNSLMDTLKAAEAGRAEAEGEADKARADVAALRKELADLRAEFDARPRSAARGDAPVLAAEHPLAKEAKAVEADDSLRQFMPGLFKK